MDIPVDYVDIDPNFEPLSRVRSNTWPLRPVEVSPDSQNSPGCDEIAHADNTLREVVGPKGSKSASRRNAWGNLSYADLITNAIKSSPDQRLTLSQIYDWMVHNVPFFRDKGESNSSAGWKNSIRHNLSLHNRFMRLPNEGGAGKSSWWVINPEAKPGKTQRARRANSMETKTMEKKRHRARKRVEALRAMEANGSPTHPGDDRYLLSPIDPGPFRDRTSSNASTLSGRLSPIPAFDKDIDDELGSWGSNGNLSGAYLTKTEMPDNLVDSLMDSMRLVDGNIGLAATPEESMITENVDQGYMSAGNSSLMYGYNQGSQSFGESLTRLSPIYTDRQNVSPQQVGELGQHSSQDRFPGAMVMGQPQGTFQQQGLVAESTIMEDVMMPSLGQGLSVQNRLSPCVSPQRNMYLGAGMYHSSPASSPQATQLSPNSASPASSPQMSPQQPVQLSPQEVRRLILNSSLNPHLQQHLQQMPAVNAANSLLLKVLTNRTNSQLTQTQIQQLKALSKRKLDPDRRISPTQQQTYSHQIQQANTMMSPCLNLPSNTPVPPPVSLSSQAQVPTADGSFLTQFSRDSSPNANTKIPLSNPVISDVPGAGSLNDIDLASLQGVDCDVDRVLDYEMSLGGDLDFNFEANGAKNSYVH